MPHEKDQTHWHEPSGSKKAGYGEFKKQPTPYDAFMESEGVPVFRDIGISRVQNLPLAPWKRKGGRGADITGGAGDAVIPVHVRDDRDRGGAPGVDMEPAARASQAGGRGLDQGHAHLLILTKGRGGAGRDTGYPSGWHRCWPAPSSS